MRWQHHVRVGVEAGAVASRRDFLKGVSTAALAAGTLSWPDLMGLKADELRRRGRACILLWMQGGPSQFETFSPKPGHENGGDTKAIATNVPGIEIAENYPQLAQLMDRLAVIRSMTSKEGNHQRASYLLHTGYVPSASVKYPTLGSLVGQQLLDESFELPAYVRIGRKDRSGDGAGFLGAKFDPFDLQAADQTPANTQPATAVERYQRRLGLLDRLERNYAAAGGAAQVEGHRQLYRKASRMILSPQMAAFDLDRESDATRDAYGRDKFGAGCLLARRLVETGVPFVEVALGGWDTHDDVFDRCASLAGQLDRPFAQLLLDLEARGLLETTLVVWMGEFGRTPKINGRGGRDHYPRAFNVALAGGGVRGGRVIGATDEGGTEVVERPVLVTDLFQSFCKALGIDASHENMSGIGRPIKLVDGGQVVDELFG